MTQRFIILMYRQELKMCCQRLQGSHKEPVIMALWTSSCLLPCSGWNLDSTRSNSSGKMRDIYFPHQLLSLHPLSFFFCKIENYYFPSDKAYIRWNYCRCWLIEGTKTNFHYKQGNEQHKQSSVWYFPHLDIGFAVCVVFWCSAQVAGKNKHVGVSFKWGSEYIVLGSLAGKCVLDSFLRKDDTAHWQTFSANVHKYQNNAYEVQKVI